MSAIVQLENAESVFLALDVFALVLEEFIGVEIVAFSVSFFSLVMERPLVRLNIIWELHLFGGPFWAGGWSGFREVINSFLLSLNQVNYHLEWTLLSKIKLKE